MERERERERKKERENIVSHIYNSTIIVRYVMCVCVHVHVYLQYT